MSTEHTALATLALWALGFGFALMVLEERAVAGRRPLRYGAFGSLGASCLLAWASFAAVVL